MAWTQSEVNAYNARQDATRQRSQPVAAVEVEGDLHDQIFDECRRRGWIALHGAMSERTHRNLGEWDFTILADNGRVFLVECKNRVGKLSTAQRALHAWAIKLGHSPQVVRSLEEFLSIINK